ncbi:MAG: aspartate/glutamate racemase family protein [Thermaerobacter sp.]|nr:aspartate/glutamate racemase family protein [Thermaerobacter sp.]
MANILLINPNTNQALTDTVVKEALSVAHPSFNIQGFTPRTGLPAIDSEDDAAISAEACWGELGDNPGPWDGVIVACYSVHPLVERLQTTWQRPVVGIMQASWWAAQRLGLTPYIVTSSESWVSQLQRDLIGAGLAGRVSSIDRGVTAIVDDPVQAARALQKVLDEEKRGDVAICLGCAAMSGLETILSPLDVPVIDGVKAAVEYLRVVLGVGPLDSGRVAL